MFNHEELFTVALQLRDPFFVKSKDFNLEVGELHLYIDFKIGAKFQCPVCHEDGKPVHDTEDKVWRHLNFFQYKAFIHCRTPRVKCGEHGVRLIEVPWAAPGSGFTLLFEALVLKQTRSMPVPKRTQFLQENDTRIWRIIKRYVDDALDKVRRTGQHEESAQKYSRYLWLHNPGNLKSSQQATLYGLTKMNLKTSRAYRIKSSLQDVYNLANDRRSGEEMLKKWYD